LQCHSRGKGWSGDGFPGEGNCRPVRRDRGVLQVGIRIVRDHAAFPGSQVDPQQQRALGRFGPGDPPRRDEETAVGADVEHGIIESGFA
jgi:hypothetical protein